MPKSPNGAGSGEIISLAFNLDNPVERKAWEISQQLAASGHGNRKDAIIMFLATIYDVQQITGQYMDAQQIGARLLSALLTGGNTNVENVTPEDPLIIVKSSEVKTGEEIAETFKRSVSYIGQEDDLW